MIDADIYDAFATAATVFAAAQSPPLPIAFPGVQFTPPDAGAWLEAMFFPNETQNYGVGNSGPSQHRGFFQLAVAVRKGVGLVPPAEVAGAVLAMFEKGTLWGPARVYRKGWISSVVQGSGVAEKVDRLILPVTIPYIASPPRDVIAFAFDGGDSEAAPDLVFEGGDVTPDPLILLDAGGA